MNRFQRDTAIETLGEGRYAARIDRGWWIVRGPNGGYVAAILVRALAAAVGDPARMLRSLTIHFTSPPSEGETLVTTTRERAGRSLTTATARLTQDGRLCALAVAAFSRERPGPTFDHMAMPEVAPPEQCSPAPATHAPSVGTRDRYETLPAIGAFPGTEGSEALTGGWIRLSDAPGPVEPALVAAYTDAWPPAVFAYPGRDALPRGLPTVDLTVHFRAPYPADADPTDFVLAVFRSRYSAGGFVEEDGELWTRDGQLLAQSRQLAVIG